MKTLSTDFAITLSSELQAPLAEAYKREWYETSGLGGWAAGSVLGFSTRRYHGLLVVPGAGGERRVLVSRCEELLECSDGIISLTPAVYPDYSDESGKGLLRSFSSGIAPEWRFELPQGELRKTIVAVHKSRTVIVAYHFSSGFSEASLLIRPFVVARSYHHLRRATGAALADAHWDSSIVTLEGPELSEPVMISAPGGVFHAAPSWYYRFVLLEEKARGFDYEEDLFTPGVIKVPARGSVYLLLSAERAELGVPKEMFDAEMRRRESLTKDDPRGLEGALRRAARQFLVTGTSQRPAVIAGYPWFTPWGRDTMIALPGLAAVQSKEESFAAIDDFLDAAHNGLIPNRLSDGPEPFEYNTIDATLWLFSALYWLSEMQGNLEETAKRYVDRLLDIVAWHHKGTSFGICVDDDGLLKGGSYDTQLTWMDAKVGSTPVTPRWGKAVEINALWLNALRITAEFAEVAGNKSVADSCRGRANDTAHAFEKLFWSDSHGYLCDVVTQGSDGTLVQDWSFRPNQVIALSLPFDVLSDDRARRILRRVHEELYTPRGLRTLSPSDPRYCGLYRGGPEERDRAYHQGTAWPWLLGPYLRAVRRYEARQEYERVREEVREALRRHLPEAGVGSVSEIVDGDPPHEPGGCPLQAWSVTELLRELF